MKPALPRKRRRRRPFVDLLPAELEAASPDSNLFLGRLDHDRLRRELEAAGILAALARRGFPEVALRTEREADEHRLRVLPARGRVTLIDLRVAETALAAGDPALRGFGVDVLSFLAVRWLSLQDPKRRFTRERPRLPGQRHPGLGLGTRLYAVLKGWAAGWGKDGLLNFPEYFHNAVLYSTLFRFVAPARQGRFEALARDLAPLHVAAASAALDAGRVVDAASGDGVRWEAGEMVAPLTAPLQAYLDSPVYRDAVAAVRDSVRFEVQAKRRSRRS